MWNLDFKIAEDGTIIRGATTSPKQPKKSKTWLIILLLLFCGGGIGIGYYLNNQSIESQAVQSVDVAIEAVSDFPNEQQIKNLIKDYYAIFRNNEYYKLDIFFAETVSQYFNQTNVKGATIKEKYRKYHEETLKTKSASFSVRWDTFKLKQINNMISASFILDYYLNTERYGNQKYVLRIRMDINNECKIVGITEDTIERINL